MLSGLIQRIGLLSASTMLGSVSTILVLPILSRIYTPTDFGQYASVVAISSVAATISCLRLDQAILVADADEQNGLARISLIFSVVISVLAALVTAGFLGWTNAIYVLVAVYSSSILQLMYSLFLAQDKFKACAAINIGRPLTTASAQIGVATTHIAGGLLVGMLAANLLFIIAGIIFFTRRFTNHSNQRVKLSDYRDFIYHNAPHALLNSGSYNLPYLLINGWLSHAAVGYYAIVERVMRLPINYFSQAIRSSYMRLFAAKGATLAENRAAAIRGTNVLALITAPVFLAAAIVPEAFLVHIMGPNWTGIGQYLDVLAAGYWATSFNPPVAAYIIYSRNSKYLLYAQTIEVAVKVIGFFALYYVLHSDWALVSISASLVFYNCCCYVIAHYAKPAELSHKIK